MPIRNSVASSSISESNNTRTRVSSGVLHSRMIKFQPAKFEIFKTEKNLDKKLSHLHRAKICWSETILSCWSGNVSPIQIWDSFQTKNPSQFRVKSNITKLPLTERSLCNNPLLTLGCRILVFLRIFCQDLKQQKFHLVLHSLLHKVQFLYCL